MYIAQRMNGEGFASVKEGDIRIEFCFGKTCQQVKKFNFFYKVGFIREKRKGYG
jgi:hypothetical protein